MFRDVIFSDEKIIKLSSFSLQRQSSTQAGNGMLHGQESVTEFAHLHQYHCKAYAGKYILWRHGENILFISLGKAPKSVWKSYCIKNKQSKKLLKYNMLLSYY